MVMFMEDSVIMVGWWKSNMAKGPERYEMASKSLPTGNIVEGPSVQHLFEEVNRLVYLWLKYALVIERRTTWTKFS